MDSQQRFPKKLSTNPKGQTSAFENTPYPDVLRRKNTFSTQTLKSVTSSELNSRECLECDQGKKGSYGVLALYGGQGLQEEDVPVENKQLVLAKYFKNLEGTEHEVVKHKRSQSTITSDEHLRKAAPVTSSGGSVDDSGEVYTEFVRYRTEPATLHSRANSSPSFSLPSGSVASHHKEPKYSVTFDDVPAVIRFPSNDTLGPEHCPAKDHLHHGRHAVKNIEMLSNIARLDETLKDADASTLLRHREAIIKQEADDTPKRICARNPALFALSTPTKSNPITSIEEQMKQMQAEHYTKQALINSARASSTVLGNATVIIVEPSQLHTALQPLTNHHPEDKPSKAVKPAPAPAKAAAEAEDEDEEVIAPNRFLRFDKFTVASMMKNEKDHVDRLLAAEKAKFEKTLAAERNHFQNSLLVQQNRYSFLSDEHSRLLERHEREVSRNDLVIEELVRSHQEQLDGLAERHAADIDALKFQSESALKSAHDSREGLNYTHSLLTARIGAQDAVLGHLHGRRVDEVTSREFNTLLRRSGARDIPIPISHDTIFANAAKVAFLVNSLTSFPAELRQSFLEILSKRVGTMYTAESEKHVLLLAAHLKLQGEYQKVDEERDCWRERCAEWEGYFQGMVERAAGGGAGEERGEGSGNGGAVGGGQHVCGHYAQEI